MTWPQIRIALSAPNPHGWRFLAASPNLVCYPPREQFGREVFHPMLAWLAPSLMANTSPKPWRWNRSSSGGGWHSYLTDGLHAKSSPQVQITDSVGYLNLLLETTLPAGVCALCSALINVNVSGGKAVMDEGAGLPP